MSDPVEVAETGCFCFSVFIALVLFESHLLQTVSASFGLAPNVPSVVPQPDYWFIQVVFVAHALTLAVLSTKYLSTRDPVRASELSNRN